MPNVLVFESDGGFAGELKGELERRGCRVTVVDDASVGLQTAASDRPDLILLTIELPRMNGFSVCNKLKRDPALKEVPLIIMSSDSTEETFEQHRRLRTHAEDYVHKPISFLDLLPRITAHVSLGNGEAAAEEDVLIDTDVDFVEGTGTSVPPPPSGGAPEPDAVSVPSGGVDDEVDAFTENAFGSMMEEREDPVAAALQSVPSSPLALPFSDPQAASADALGIDLDAVSLPPGVNAEVHAVAALEDAPPMRSVSSIPPRPRIESVDTALREELTRQAERARDLEKELREARSRVESLEDEAARAATKDAEVQRLQRELDEVKAKASAGTTAKGGGSAREFLDLREALNKKDKELLELRDQITHREKELLGLRDTNLEVERAKADLEEKAESLDKQATDATRLLDSAKADKEQASKRADDYKRKVEKLQSELDAKTTEFDDVKRKADEDAAARVTTEAALRAELEETRTSAERDRTAAVASAAAEATRVATEEGERSKAAALAEINERGTRDREQAVQARELDLRREQDAKLAALHRANEEALNRMRAEHAQAITDEKKAAADSLADQEARYAREHEAVIKEYEASHQSTKNELAQVIGTLEDVRRQKAEGEAERDARVAGLTADVARLESELESFRLRLEERTAQHDAAQATLTATRSELAEAQQSLSSEQGKTSRAGSKWSDDRASLERAKDALAAALAQLDDIEGRPLT